MTVRTLSIVAFAFALASSSVGAQQTPPNSPGEETRQPERGSPGRYFSDDDDDRKWRGRHMGPRGYERGHHYGYHRESMPMMGPGMGGPMMRMMMILMDTDGNGSVSLQEFQAGHERMFKAMDSNNDGTLSLEEVRGFHQSLRRSDQ